MGRNRRPVHQDHPGHHRPTLPQTSRPRHHRDQTQSSWPRPECTAATQTWIWIRLCLRTSRPCPVRNGVGQRELIGWHDKFASAYAAFLDSCRLPPGRRRRSRWSARSSARTNGLEVRRRVGHTRRRGRRRDQYHLMCRVSAGWPGPGRRLRYARPGPRFSRVRGSGSSQDFGQRQREVCLRATRLGTWPGSADMGLARLRYPCPGLGEGGMQLLRSRASGSCLSGVRLGLP